MVTFTLCVFTTVRKKDIIKRVKASHKVQTSICKSYTDNGFDSEYIFYIF